MTLAQEFILLTLPDNMGRSVGAPSNLSHALTGTMIMELMLIGKLKMDERGRLLVVDSAATGDAMLDDVLARIRHAKRPAKAHSWISNLAFGLSKLRAHILQDLVKQSVVQAEPRRFLGLIRYTHYYLLDSTHAERIRQRIRGVLIGGETPGARTMLLIAVLQASSFLRAQLPKSERAQAAKKAAQMMKENAVAKAVADANAAIAAAMVAATTASS